MKKILLLLMTLSFNATANTVTTSDVEAIFPSSSKYSFAGTTYVNTGDGSVGSVQQGIGEITTISNALGNVIWTAGTGGINLFYVFDQYVLDTVVVSSVNPTAEYNTTGGIVDFYASSSDLFTPTGNFVTDKDALLADSLLFLSTTAKTYDGVHTIYGTKSSTGQGPWSAVGGSLNAVGGPTKSFFDKNGLSNGADLSFAISGDTINTNGYTSNGSLYGTGLSGTPVPTPAPLPLLMMGFGLMIVGYMSQKAQA